jgi:hypothetical protein
MCRHQIRFGDPLKRSIPERVCGGAKTTGPLSNGVMSGAASIVIPTHSAIVGGPSRWRPARAVRVACITLALIGGLFLGATRSEAGFLVSTTNEIVQVSSSGNQTVFAPLSGSNQGLGFDQSGNLYVANYSGGVGSIDKFSPTGQSLGVFASGLGGQPLGLAINNSGDV